MKTATKTAKLPDHVHMVKLYDGTEKPVLEIERCIPHPEKPGMLQYVGNIKAKELGAAVTWYLRKLGHHERFDYAHAYDDAPDFEIPRYRWISVYAVAGTNEGHYLHVDVIEQNNERANRKDTRRMVYLAKTFEGLRFAYEVCADLADFLQV